MKSAGFNVTHVYGLTETYGPASFNDWHREWDALPGSEQAAKKARQGVRYPVLDALRRDRSGNHGSRCRATARRWAK